MKLIRALFPLALTVIASGAVPKQVMKDMLSYSRAKLDSNQNMEMMMRAKESTWQEVRDRLVEINTENLDFWMKEYRHYNTLGFDAPQDEKHHAREQLEAYAEGIIMLKEYHPGWTKDEQVKAHLEAIGYSLDLQDKIITGS